MRVIRQSAHFFTLLTMTGLSFAARGHQQHLVAPPNVAQETQAAQAVAAKPDAHLSFSDEIHAYLYWVAGPTVGSESELRVEFLQGIAHEPIALSAPPTVSLWMPDMGHGSAPPATASLLDVAGVPVPGAYKVAGLYFIMDGLWEVRLTLNFEDGRSETQSFDVDFGGGGEHSHH